MSKNISLKLINNKNIAWDIIRILFRGYAQILLQSSALTGFFFLGGVCNRF